MVSSAAAGVTVSKAGRKRKYTCINMITRPVNKELENNMTVPSTVDVMTPLALYTAKLVFPQV